MNPPKIMNKVKNLIDLNYAEIIQILNKQKL